MIAHILNPGDLLTHNDTGFHNRCIYDDEWLMSFFKEETFRIKG